MRASKLVLEARMLFESVRVGYAQRVMRKFAEGGMFLHLVSSSAPTIFAQVMKQKQQKILLDNERFGVTIERLCLQLWEDWELYPDRCIIGIQPRGIELAQRIHGRLEELTGQKIPFGILDITFYRDDFRMREEPLTPHQNVIDFLVGGKHVLLVDDVLYTGRTIQAALSALQHYGRPDKVDLLALVDRRFNRDLPVQASYVGLAVDALEEAYVRVHWKELEGEDKIVFFDKR